MPTRPDCGSTSPDVPQQQRRECGLDLEEFRQVVDAIATGYNVLVLGEAGQLQTEFAQALLQRFSTDLKCAIGVYKGSGKAFFKHLAEQLDIPTESEDDEGKTKALTMEALREEVLSNVGSSTLLILPEAKRLPASIRYWLEDAIAEGCRVCCFAPVNPGRDVFLDMVEVELQLPGDRHIREIMESEARAQGLHLSQSRLAELQPLAGRNPMLARKVIRQEKLGIRQQKPEHTQYVTIMPIVIAALFSFAVVRFIGLGTNNKALYVFGGCSLVAAMGLKQLGQVRGSRKRLGQ